MQNSVIVIWERDGVTKDTISSVAEKVKIKDYIIDCLQNKQNDILQVDWSDFGEVGDCIKIV